MANKRIIKCTNCGLFNTDKEYCTNCNTLISHQKKIEIKKAAVKQKHVDKIVWAKENPNFVEKLKKHPYFLYKVAGWLMYSAVVVISTIGAGFAWFIAMVAAG